MRYTLSLAMPSSYVGSLYVTIGMDVDTDVQVTTIVDFLIGEGGPFEGATVENIDRVDHITVQYPASA
jgi:hypothetical protein